MVKERQIKAHKCTELIAATKTLEYFTRNIRGENINMQIDNKSAIAYINKKGGTKSRELLTLALKFWEIVTERDLYVTATYINTKENKSADLLSRSMMRKMEWSLNTEVFRLITELWGTPQVDLFASRTNRQVHQYISWKWEKEAVAIDALKTNWGRWSITYAYPEPILIGKVLKKIRDHHARRRT